jgi:hypothetical protein
MLVRRDWYVPIGTCLRAEREVIWDVEDLERHAGLRAPSPQAGNRVSRAKAATAVVRIFGAFLVVVGLALLVASVLEGLGGN